MLNLEERIINALSQITQNYGLDNDIHAICEHKNNEVCISLNTKNGNKINASIDLIEVDGTVNDEGLRLGLLEVLLEHEDCYNLETIEQADRTIFKKFLTQARKELCAEYFCL